MTIDQIEQDYKQAFKAKDELRKSSLGNVRAALKDAEIAKRDKLTDAEVMSVIAKKVKQHKDSISEFEKGNRPDLVEKETAQMQVLESYLPAKMSEDEVRKIVKEVISQSSATPADFGKVMKQVLAQAQGGADGSVVSKLVKEELKQNG